MADSRVTAGKVVPHGLVQRHGGLPHQRWKAHPLLCKAYGEDHKDKWSTRLKLENHSVPCSLQCAPVFLVMLLFNSGTRGTRNFGARCRSPRHAKSMISRQDAYSKHPPPSQLHAGQPLPGLV